MRYLILILFFIHAFTSAQIKGNQNIITKEYPLENLNTLKINLYAKVTVDASQNTGMTITTDENLFPYIQTKVDDGVLHLDQKEWIAASQPILIKIGAPLLKRLETGTHDITRLINLDLDKLLVIAPVGNIILSGRVENLSVGSELSTIDATNCMVTNARIDIWSRGYVKVNVSNTLSGKVTNDGKLVYANQPKSLEVKTRSGGVVKSLIDEKGKKADKITFIKFKIRNNSGNRNHFYVVGNNGRGSKFSYGFPMMPLSKRAENWSVGTKIYKVNSLGFKKLLHTITIENEGTTVDLF